jgi:hypothetical protein
MENSNSLSFIKVYVKLVESMCILISFMTWETRHTWDDNSTVC